MLFFRRVVVFLPTNLQLISLGLFRFELLEKGLVFWYSGYQSLNKIMGQSLGNFTFPTLRFKNSKINVTVSGFVYYRGN